MDCKELMIGDYVFYNDSLIKVENIHEDFINYSPDIPYVQEEFFIDIADVKSIPLTPEILKKNGYHITPVYDMEDENIIYTHIDLLGEWTWYNGKIYYSITDDEVVEMFECKYVHEFQHFLRLVGVKKEIKL